MSPAETPSRPTIAANALKDDSRRVFRIASRPGPLKDNPTGWSASRVVSAAYRFADAIRRDAGRD